MMKKLVFVRLFALLAAVFSALTLLPAADSATISGSPEPTAATRFVPIIDAGHGGFDGGAISSSGVIESGLNLEIALRLAELFRFFGVEPALIRETDTALGDPSASGKSAKQADLSRRVELINAVENGFLISIHQNKFGDSSCSGAHIFYSGEAAKPVAELVQSSIIAQLDPSNHRAAEPVASSLYIFKKADCPGILAECGFISNDAELARLISPGYQK